ncbi:MAG: hypothetical protein DRJ65_20720 [Acidobacteria bacterium]|nr:MAG: hypothetical protein DRJ65_20720 [Acidobacteriota bacterium]
MRVRAAIWVASLYAGSVAGILGLVLLMRLNPDIEPSARTFFVGVPLWMGWGAFLIGIPLGLGAWVIGRSLHARGWGVSEGTVALLALVLCLAAILSWVNAEIHPEFLSETGSRQLRQDAVMWFSAALMMIAVHRWWRRMKRRRWIASVMLLLIILLPVGRMVGEPTSFFKSLEVKVQPLDRSARPLLVCGIEGLDISVLLTQGGGRNLSNFDRLTEEGARGPLSPFRPFLDQAHWTTMATGTLPRTHGVMFRWGWQYPVAFDGTLRLLPWTPQGSRLFLAWDRGIRVAPPPSTVPPLWQRMAFSQTPTTILDWPGIWDEGAAVRRVRPPLDPWATGHSLEASLGAILVGNFPRAASEILSTLRKDEARVEQARLALEAGRENVWLSLHTLAVGRRLLEPHRTGETGRREALALVLELVDDQIGRLMDALPEDGLVAVVSPYGFALPDPLERLRRLLGFGGNWRASAEGCPEGALFLVGEGVAAGQRLAPVGLEDMAPTLCYLLDLPVAQYMEGRVILEAVEPEWLATHPLRVVE